MRSSMVSNLTGVHRRGANHSRPVVTGRVVARDPWLADGFAGLA